MEKKLIRRQILEKRKNLGEKKRQLYSKEIINKIFSSSYYENAKTIMSFVSFSDEVDTHEFIKQAIKDGKNIVVPVTFPKTYELKPSLLKSFDDLELGYHNILAPKKELQNFIHPSKIDLIITPGVAFRKDGYRIGYGGGYYDRFLVQIPNVPTIAIAFNIQIVDNLPTDKFDIPVNYIYTESNIINCKDAN